MVNVGTAEVAEVRFSESDALQRPSDKGKLSDCQEIFLFYHGWLNDPQSARRELYELLAASIKNEKYRLFQGKFGKIGFLFAYWPSKEFPPGGDPLPARGGVHV
ncbi:hypothetical protein A7Q09_05075 [Methylacidiphilum sp. Yel]|uniref:hypothetical protein n=1 Tax=Methylacidiphilum sp. Yel TaxID=1847730 RepID=UPI00106B5141|nr:hypothetical protein [Methylacidiphilum sp. Yel]TFE69668.1 hypothetical protein A7Q09_05075 [Methylacidiphilum sp. Yel]